MKSAINEKYSNIDFDESKRLRVQYLERTNTPWKFENLLPYPINVYMRRFTMTQLICSLAPAGASGSTVSTTQTNQGLKLQDGDAIHVMRPIPILNTTRGIPNNGTGGQQVEIARPVFLFADSREVKIGDIVYEDRAAFVNGIDISHDMIGLRIHNHLTLPIDVYWKGLKIAQIAGDDGTNFMAGSPNSVYLNNERAGFNVDDLLSFTFTNDQKKYATVRLIDNWTSDIIIGETTQKFVAPIQDMYGYRVNGPNVNGLRYFSTNGPGGAYKSIGEASGQFGPKNSMSRSDVGGAGATKMNLLQSQKGVKL